MPIPGEMRRVAAAHSQGLGEERRRSALAVNHHLQVKHDPPHAEGTATWLVITDEVQSQGLTQSEEGGSPPHPVTCRGMGEAVYPGGAASGGVLGSHTHAHALYEQGKGRQKCVHSHLPRQENIPLILEQL